MISDKRIRVIIGHYGSGKTEFSVNYAIALAEKGEKVAIADLDIVNPYFRSREKKKLMEDKGIMVIGSSLTENKGTDLPALSPRIIAPLQDDTYNVLLDVGGDAVGAKVLASYTKYFQEDDYDMFCIVNANRPETSDDDGVQRHIQEIEDIVGIKVTGLVNNTHFLKETSVEDVEKGQRIVSRVSNKLEIPVKYTCAINEISSLISERVNSKILPINMYMREDWM